MGPGIESELIDAHAHLHAEEFDNDLRAILAAAESAGVRTILAVSETAAASTGCSSSQTRQRSALILL